MIFQPHRRPSAATFATAFAMLALVAPATSARPAEDFLGPQPSETACEPSRDPNGSDANDCDEPAAASEGTVAPAVEPRTASTARDISSDPGFDWGAAAIGAGAATALMLLGSMAAIAFIGRGRVRVAPETEPAGMPIKTRR